MVDKLPPLHPGEILREEFMTPLGLTAGMVARAVSVPRTRIERIASEQIGISADTAIRLAQLFGTTPQFWMNAQAGFDLDRAQDRLDEVTSRIQPIAHDPASESAAARGPSREIHKPIRKRAATS